MARSAYCTGCNTVFAKVHMLRRHRNTFRCGGPFTKWFEEDRIPFPPHYFQSGNYLDGSSWHSCTQSPVTTPNKRKARTPGTIRKSRLTGGPGYRNNWEGTPP